MADKTIVVRAVYRSNVATGMRQDAGAIAGISAKVESSAVKSVNSVKAMGAASAVAGKLMVLGIGGALAVSAKAAIEFESSMAGVAKTTDLTGNSFDKNSGSLFEFGEALRDLALRTPINVNDLAQIAELGGQLGIETDSLLGFTEVMAQLGVTTNMSATEAATGMARFANIMRTPQDEFDRLGSVVVELGNNFATTESEILHFATRIAPTMRVVGATEEEVFALATALSALGVPAERGGSAIQKWMILAKKAVDSGGASLEKFADVAGVTSEEFVALFQRSPGEAFAAFAHGLDRINESGGNLFGTMESLQLSEVRMTQVLLAAAGGADELTEALGAAKEEGEEVNALYEEAAKRFGTTESQIALVVNAFNDLRIAVGNALLESGGLAFGLDVMKEFFGIIGDNLGTLQNLVTVMGILVGIRIGVFFLQAAGSAQQAFAAFKGTAAGMMQVGAATRVAQGGMLLLTGAMQGALGVAGILAGIWLTQAINAAQLKAEVKALNEEIAAGTDPVEAFSKQVEDALSQEQVDFLHEMGFSIQDLTQYLMDGQPAASELGQALSGLRDNLGKPVDDPFNLETSSGRILKIIEDVGGKVDDIFMVKRNELVDAFIQTGEAIPIEKLRELADLAIGEFGFDITDDQFLDWMENASYATGHLGDKLEQAHIQAMNFGNGVDSIELNWKDLLPPEDADDIMEDFFEGNVAAVDEFNEAMQEAFDEVGEVVRGGMPVWEEYHKAVLGSEDTPSWETVRKAQEDFLEDTRDWIERMPDIMAMGASPDTVEWIDSLEAPIRGAIGRLNDAQLQELIDGANRNFDELNKLHLERWMQVFGGNATLAFGAMVDDIASRANEMLPPGELTAQAFVEGLMTTMAGLDAQEQEAFRTFLAALLENEQWLEEMGMGEMGAYIEGLLIEAGLLAAKVKPVLSGQFVEIKNWVDGQWGVQSPSKWWQHLGEQFTAGLKLGAEGLNTAIDFKPELAMPAMTPGLGSMSTINNNRSAQYNLTINSPGLSSNIRAEVQTLLTLLTIVGGVEQGAGR